MPSQTEVAELRQMIETQQMHLAAVSGTMLSLFDVIGHVLQTRNVADRSEIADQLREIVAKARADTRRAVSELSAREIETQTFGQGLLAAFADRLTAEPPAAGTPLLRVVR